MEGKMKRNIFVILGIYFIISYNTLFSQSTLKENILNSNIAIELLSGEKLEGKVVEIDSNFIVIYGTTSYGGLKNYKYYFSEITRIFDKEYKIIFENKNNEIIKELEEKVKKIPISKYQENLDIYKKLNELNPENEIYKNKIYFYEEKLSSASIGYMSYRVWNVWWSNKLSNNEFLDQKPDASFLFY